MSALEAVDFSLRETAYAVGSAYFPVRQGAPVELDTHALAGDVRVAYSRPEPSPATLTVRVNGAVHTSQPVTDASGVVAVYGLPAGTPSVSVEVEPWTSDATLFITHLRDGPSRRGRTRRAMGDPAPDLSLPYSRAEILAFGLSVLLLGLFFPSWGRANSHIF